MSGNTNFPTGLDTDVSLFDVGDGVDSVSASHHNNLKEAVKAIQTKLGIYSSGTPTSIDYRLGHPSFGHTHDGASGQGGPVAIPSSGDTRFRLQSHAPFGFNSAGTQVIPPVFVDRTAQIEAAIFITDVGPNGGSHVWDVMLNGATSLWFASPGKRPTLLPTTGMARATVGAPNIVTIPSGSVLTIDAINSVAGGVVNPSFLFVFRE